MIASGGWLPGQRYAERVVGGEIVASRAVIGACQRHLDDIAKQGETGFAYYFDENAAATVLDMWPSLFCHSKGDFAGQPFHLEPWQAFGIGAFFGWKRLSDEARRFRELYWSMGRKNGKSAVLSGLAILMGGFDYNPKTKSPESVAEVVIAATKLHQATEVNVEEIKRMRARSPVISGLTSFSYNQLVFKHNGGKILAVGSDKPFDGLGPSACLADELHQWQEYQRGFWNTLVTGSGHRLQPCLGIFTTAGDSRSYLWNEIYTRCKSVALQQIEDDECLPLIYELDDDDDPFDESTWTKANPNLDVSIRREYLEQQARKARISTQATNVFDRYHCNRRVSATSRAISEEYWKRAAGDLSDWSSADAIGAGVDLGGRDDLASFSMVARFHTNQEDEDGQPLYRYEARVWAYLAESTERDINRAPISNWIAEGKIRLCKLPITELQADLMRELGRWPVDSTAYDPAGGQQFAESIQLEGYRIASMAQTYRYFHEPIGDLQRCLAEGRFRHNGCEFLAWCVGNAVTVSDRQCRIMFDKSASTDKIDPLVAMTMAFARAKAAIGSISGSLFIS